MNHLLENTHDNNSTIVFSQIQQQLALPVGSSVVALSFDCEIA